MNDEQPTNAPIAVLPKRQSQNSSISQYLRGAVFTCDKEGTPTGEAIEFFTVEADKTLEGQYSSPFENSNPEQRLPTLLGNMQAGDWLGTLDSALSGIGISLSSDTKEKLNSFEGRTNFTKTNSTQIYIAAAPIKFNVTAYFYAWLDARREVEDQVAQLESYCLPVELSQQSLIGNAIAQGDLQALFPSIIPPYVGLQIANKTYSPLFLETISAPLITQLDSNGDRLTLEVQMTFVTRQAWDQKDLKNVYTHTF